MASVKSSYNNCARKDSEFCKICENDDFFITELVMEELDAMCDLICGCIEESEE